MGVVLAVIGAVFFLAGALLYGGVLRSAFRHVSRETQAAYTLSAVGMAVMVLSVVPIPGVTR